MSEQVVLPFRAKCLQSFQQLTPEQHQDYWVQVEENLFEFSHRPDHLTDVHPYYSKYIQLYATCQNHTEFVLQHFSPQQLVFLDYAEIDPSVKQENEARKTHIQQYKQILENRDEGLTGAIKCRCGSTDISINLKQTRSADEPMTSFCVCKKCHKQWKMN